ncbi:MAG: HEAT repeat domain-containing protein [Polyangiaceae bacterium]
MSALLMAAAPALAGVESSQSREEVGQTVPAQFNPGGRGKPKPGGFRPGGRPGGAKPGGAKPGGAKPGGAKPGGAKPGGTKPGTDPEAGPGKGPGKDALIARYTGIVLSQPASQFPLQRLAELYRERDGNLEKLIADFEKRAADPQQPTALVALAGIYKQDGQQDRAIATYEKAIAKNPKDPDATMALAHVLFDRGDKAGALARYEKALPLLKSDAEKEQTLRTLMQLSLDLKRYDDASKHHKALVLRAKNSFYVKGELARELMLRAEYARAVTEYRAVVKAAAGDNRVLAPALRDLGNALAKQGNRKEAMETLQRALRVAGAQSGIRAEIYEIISEVYRAEDRLRELVAEIEKRGAHEFEEIRMLARLYEETGQVKKALTTYKQALAKKNGDIATRLKVVQLLQIQGELDEAIREYEALIRAAPRNPDYVFQLAEALIQRGDRKKALEHLKQLEGRSRQDEETLAALVDFYERVEEKDRAMQVLQRLGNMGSRDPRHLVELGARYWEEGDKQKALTTWQRIKTLVADKAHAQHTLGEVYLEHDMPVEALAAFREAMKLKPKNAKYRKAYAMALERTGSSAGSQEARNRQYDEARRIWETILKESGDNKYTEREARQHIVTLWSLSGQLEQRAAPLARRLRNKPPDLEAGRLLAEVQIRLRRYADAERTLQLVVKAAPGDGVSLGRLERVLVLQRKLKEAIAVLKKLIEADPKRAREAYQRMAQYAAELYQDDDAIRYAARAVELSPDDAEGHRKLGEMYRRRQETSKAIAAFRQSIQKNDRLFPVYFQLAELLISQGQTEEADLLLRRVVRASPDEELVAQAARLSMQVNLGRGTLESLEKELLPVALGNPQKPIYRRLLVDIYGAIAFPLAHRAKSGDAKEAEKARQALTKVGERAVKPLLDALSDERESQQRIAIELLSYIENKSAGPALFAFATGSADADLRARAMIAVGALNDPAMLDKMAELLAPGGHAVADESDPVILAAAWGVARLRHPSARGLLTQMLSSEAPSIRALGALGLGLAKDTKAKSALMNVARSLEAGAIPRAAAAFALGELGQADAVGVLTELSEASDPLVRATALVALSRLGAASAPRAIADALVSDNTEMMDAGIAAAAVHATNRIKNPRDPFAVPDTRVDVGDLLRRLIPSGYDAKERAEALIKIAPSLATAAVAAAQSSQSRARAIAEALLARGGAPAYGGLTADLSKLPPALGKSAEAAAESVAKAVTPAYVVLATHPSADTRILAVRLLGTRSDNDARAAVLGALTDREDPVRRAALEAIVAAKAPGSASAVTKLLEPSQSWPIRARAARALGVVAGSGQDRESALQALNKAATGDSVALVREAAVTALHQIDANASAPTLRKVAEKDAEARVRSTASKLLQGSGAPR